MADARSSPPPSARPVGHRAVDDHGWLLTFAIGVGLVVLGVWMLTNVFESVVVLAVLVGVTLIVGGAVEAVGIDREGYEGPLSWVAGGLLVAAGVAVLAWPDITLWVLAVLAGLGLIVAGVLRLQHARTRVDPQTRPVQLLLGVAEVVLGVAVVVWPGATLVVLAVLLGVRAVVTGLVAIVAAWLVHRLARGAGGAGLLA